MTLALLCLAAATLSDPPLIAVITIDTLRADRLSCYGAPSPKTPTIDRLAQAGVLFEHCYTVAPITLVAHASLMSGQYPPV
ncbi:MAG: sulfatase-like hydrolase/transferase, partial [Planctomycetota bacterium]